MRAEPALLELKLKHRFTNPELLRRALTHSSLASETRSGGGAAVSDNEQMEFLGDAVLGLVVSDVLFRRFPLSKEGELSTLKARLVSAAHLHGVARRLELGSHLELGRGEEMSGGRGKKTLLVDALEAIIAAIYLDGGLEAATSFIVEHVMDGQTVFDQEAGTDIQPAVTNFKEALRELAKAAQAAGTALLHHPRAGSGTLQDLHHRSARGQGVERAGRRAHQEDRRAARRPRRLRAPAGGRSASSP